MGQRKENVAVNCFRRAVWKQCCVAASKISSNAHSLKFIFNIITEQRAPYILAADRNVGQTGQEHFCSICCWDTKHRVISGWRQVDMDMKPEIWTTSETWYWTCLLLCQFFLSFVNKQLDHELARTFQIRIIWRPTSYVQRVVTKL
jgi:hypothetical protein